MSNFTLNSTDDVIDVRDMFERFEELESDLETYHDEQETTLSFEYALQDAVNFPDHADEYTEFMQIKAILDELCGNDGDEAWRGDWYPVTLIRDSYFESHMDEMLEDCGEMPKNLPCYLTITVDYVALQMDYTSVDIEDVTYWYR